jgi:uncharacterized protein DUF3606
MSDDKLKTVADRKRINVHEEQELRYWSHRLGVSSDELKRAVSKVGVMADDVARVLGKSWLHFAGGSRGKVGTWRAQNGELFAARNPSELAYVGNGSRSP